MEDYILTLYDENGNPIPIPAIQGIGIKEIHRREIDGAVVLEIVLDDDRVYSFDVGIGGAGLPEYTSENEGDVLRIVGGSPAWRAILNGEEVRF